MYGIQTIINNINVFFIVTLILIINILGGLIIGIWLHGLGIEEAANTYFLLSVGDGLVAQIPSLLLAIATAIIVTRVSETQNQNTNIYERRKHNWFYRERSSRNKRNRISSG